MSLHAITVSAEWTAGGGLDGLRCELCVPVDAGGLATIGHEQITNASSEPVTITSVELPESDIDVVEWTAVASDWPDGGALSGDHFPDSAGSAILDSGEEALVVLLVRTDASDSPTAVAPSIQYTDGEGLTGSLPLTWKIRVTPHDQMCD